MKGGNSIGNLVSYKTYAAGLLYAGSAVLRVSQDPTSPNHSKCDQMVRSLFGGELADKAVLQSNLQTMERQVICNVAQVKLASEDPNHPEAATNPSVYAYTYAGDLKKTRCFYVGCNWHSLTEFDRACTFVHEMSHACIRTTDIKDDQNPNGCYNPENCKVLEWPAASRNAQNYAVFCAEAFSSFLSGAMLQIAPALSSNKGHAWQQHLNSGVFTHVKGAFVKDRKFSVRTVGDKYGEKVQGGPLYKFHKIGQNATVAKNSAATFSLHSSGAGDLFHEGGGHPSSQPSAINKASGNDLQEYTVITDGVNTTYLKMLSSDVGLGMCLCGGIGGRSIRSFCRGSTSDGRVSQ